jgi:hypothetical protein
MARGPVESWRLTIVDGESYRPGAADRALLLLRHLAPAGIIRTAAYDVNVPFMQLQRHDWDIHVV